MSPKNSVYGIDFDECAAVQVCFLCVFYAVQNTVFVSYVHKINGPGHSNHFVEA